MARPAQAFGQLAYHLHADEPLEQGRCFGPSLCPVAAGTNPGHPRRTRLFGQHHHQSTSRRHRGSKKNGPQAIGRSRGGCTTKIHLVAADARCALILKLSPGQAGDAPHGRELLQAGGPVPAGCYLIMDSAYEGDETLRLARQLGYIPVVPPNPNRLAAWEYDRVVYRRRNEIERLFRRLKGYRRVFSRFDKLDVLFAGFIVFALIVEALRFSVNRP
jgi:transposase